MNREIKFRAWDKEYKEMIYPFAGFYNPESDDCKPAITIVPDATDPENYTWVIYWDGASDKKDVELAKGLKTTQYTGLKDKNEKEIYEGDIIQLYRHDDYKNYTYKHEKAEVWADGKYQPDIKEVKFMYGSFVIWSDLIKDYRCFANLARPGESLEIIGNIYENPELLPQTGR